MLECAEVIMHDTSLMSLIMMYHAPCLEEVLVIVVPVVMTVYLPELC